MYWALTLQQTGADLGLKFRCVWFSRLWYQLAALKLLSFIYIYIYILDNLQNNVLQHSWTVNTENKEPFSSPLCPP